MSDIEKELNLLKEISEMNSYIEKRELDAYGEWGWSTAHFKLGFKAIQYLLEKDIKRNNG